MHQPTEWDLALDLEAWLKRQGLDDLPDGTMILAELAARAAARRAVAAEAEVRRLQAQIAGHCERIAAQSEILSRQAANSHMDDAQAAAECVRLRQLLADARKDERSRCLAAIRQREWTRQPDFTAIWRDRTVAEIVEVIEAMLYQ